MTALQDVPSLLALSWQGGQLGCKPVCHACQNSGARRPCAAASPGFGCHTFLPPLVCARPTGNEAFRRFFPLCLAHLERLWLDERPSAPATTRMLAAASAGDCWPRLVWGTAHCACSDVPNLTGRCCPVCCLQARLEQGFGAGVAANGAFVLIAHLQVSTLDGYVPGGRWFPPRLLRPPGT